MSRAMARAVGVAGLGTFVCLLLFFAVQGPFGAINDVGNALLGVLSAVLASFCWRDGARPGPLNGLAVVGIAAAGAAVTVLGTILVMSDLTGYYLAGLVSSAGFALIGIWLVALNQPPNGHDRTRLGIVAGAVMMLGLVGVPGIVTGLDDMDSAPAWSFIGNLSWLGTYLLFPIWALRSPEQPHQETNRRRSEKQPQGYDE